MKVIKLAMIVLLFTFCNQRKRSITTNVTKEYKITSDGRLMLVQIVADGFLKNSYINITQDTVFFIPSPIYQSSNKRDIFSFTKLYFSRPDSSFIYLNTFPKYFSIDSLNTLRISNILPNVLRKAKIAQSPHYKKINNKKELKSRLKFLRYDTRISFFGGRFYCANRSTPDSLYCIDLDKKTVQCFAFKDNPMDCKELLLYDVDRDGNPEIILFHENLVPQEERLMYNIYSLRNDSVRVRIVQSK